MSDWGDWDTAEDEMVALQSRHTAQQPESGWGDWDAAERSLDERILAERMTHKPPGSGDKKREAIGARVDPNMGELSDLVKWAPEGIARGAADSIGLLHDIPAYLAPGQAMLTRAQAAAGGLGPDNLGEVPDVKGAGTVGPRIREGIEGAFPSLKKGEPETILGRIGMAGAKAAPESVAFGLGGGLATGARGAMGLGKWALREGVAGISSAAAGEGAAQLTDRLTGGESPIAREAMRLLGAVGTGAASPAIAGVARRHTPGLRRLGQGRFENVAEAEAARLIREHAAANPGDIHGLIRKGEEISKKLGIEFNLSQMLGDEGTKTMVSDFAKARPGAIGQLRGQATRTESRLRRLLGDTRPTSITKGDPIIREALESEIAGKREELEGMLDSARVDLESKIEPGAKYDAYGKVMADIIRDRVMPKFQSDVDALFRPLEEMGDGLMLATSKQKLGIQKILDGYAPPMREKLGTPMSIRQMQDAPNRISFQWFQSNREVLNGELEKAVSKGDSQLVRLLTQYKNSSDEILDDMMNAGEFVASRSVSKGKETGRPLVRGAASQKQTQKWAADVASRYQAGRKLYREGMDIFGKSIAGKVTGRGGGMPVSPSDTARRFANTGVGYPERVENWQKLRKWVDERGSASELQELDDAMGNYLMQSAFKSNGFSKKNGSAVTLKLWRDDNANMLALYPDVDKKLGSVGSAQEAFDHAGIAYKQGQRELNQSLGKTFLGEDPPTAISKILNSSNPKKAVQQLVLEAGGDPKIHDAIRQATWDHMMRRAYVDAASVPADIGGDVTRIDGEAVLAYVKNEEYKPLLNMLWGKQHRQNIEEIADAANISQRNVAPSSTRPEPIPSAIGGLKHDVKEGVNPYGARRVVASRVLDIISEYVPEGRTMEILEKAILEPQFASDLLKRVEGKEARAAVERITRRLTRSAVLSEPSLRQANQPEEESR